jgi:probable addiction module antidote protein
VIEVRHCLSRAGRDVFDDWLSRLADPRAQAKIASRINRLAAGTKGNSRPTLTGQSNISGTTKKGLDTMKRKASISHDEVLVRRLRKDPDFAAEYLKAALEDEDEPRVLLIALRHLAQAQGMEKVAKAAGVQRESLYRALSAHGNPRLSTLVAVARAIGVRLTVEAA